MSRQSTCSTPAFEILLRIPEVPILSARPGPSPSRLRLGPARFRDRTKARPISVRLMTGPRDPIGSNAYWTVVPARVMLPEEELLIQRSTSVSAESSKPAGRGSLMMRYPKTAHVTACRDFLELKVSRRRSLQAGALALTGLGLPGLLRARARSTIGPERVWPGEVVHPDLSLGRSQPA